VEISRDEIESSTFKAWKFKDIKGDEMIDQTNRQIIIFSYYHRRTDYCAGIAKNENYNITNQIPQISIDI